MAIPISLYLLLLALLTQTHASFSTTDPAIGHSSIPDVHDLLPSYNLPKGIVPDNVKSYTLSSTGEFTIELESTCYVFFDDLVYYEKTIRGKLSYGALHDVSGIQVRMLFMWFPVTGIEVDVRSGMVQFSVGALAMTLPAEQFQDIPVCKSKPLLRADPNCFYVNSGPIPCSIAAAVVTLHCLFYFSKSIIILCGTCCFHQNN